MRSTWKGVAVLCLLVTAWSAFAVVTHRHSDQSNDAACQVCVAAHSAALTQVTLAPQPVFRILQTLPVRPLAAKQRLTVFALLVRPPPGV
jgi:hypothetical protein